MIQEARACRKCGVVKPITKDFYQAIPNSTDGFRKTCLQCKSESDKARHLKIGDKKREAARVWYYENKPKKQEYDRQYRLQNRAKLNEQKKIAWHLRRAKLPIKRIVNNVYIRGRTFAKSKRFVILEKDLKKLFARQNNLCFYCAMPMNEQTGQEIDHVMPRHRGGNHSIGNIVATCRECNRVKGHRTPMEFRLAKVVHR